jgi:hypothetical protein
MKKLRLGILLSTSFNAFAVGNISPVEISGVYVRESRVDIYLTTAHTNPNGCSITNQLVLIADEFKNTNQMYSAILSAHMAGKKISGYVGVCHDNRAKLHAVHVEK